MTDNPKNNSDDNKTVEIIDIDLEPGQQKAPPVQPQGLVHIEQGLPPFLNILPIYERPFFPGYIMPVIVKEETWRATIEAINETPEKLAGILLAHGEQKPQPVISELYNVGTIVRIHDPKFNQGMIQFLAEGLTRFKITDWISKQPPLMARVSFLKSLSGDSEEANIKAYGLAILNTIKELLPLNPLYGEELKIFLSRFNPNEPSPFTDFAANLTSASKRDLQDILETASLLPRMEKVLLLLKKELEVAKLQTHIQEAVEERISDQQRTFFLRQQLEEIQRELGISKDDKTAELERFRERLKTMTVPERAQSRIDSEMDKLSILELGSPEYGVTRNYLDWLTSLPWGKHSQDKLSIRAARKILDRDHDGLSDLKDRILEFIAVAAQRGTIAGSILLFVGPPGVGKTSVGRSIAEAVGRKFYRFSLGGMRDEAEIKGHRRTYIGAMPGKFIQAIKETGTDNPVIMLDEIDKVGASYHGDPASALLETLDPEQNVDFLDHYLDVSFDLSKVLFICTANQIDTIPAALLDRMESIHLAGYITAEKIEIARNHLWPRQLDHAGLSNGKLKITDAALEKIIEGYAREAGVRGLEKMLRKIIRKAVVKMMNNRKLKSVRIGVRNITDYLGNPRFTPEKPSSGVGVITGLAWTTMGGATLDIEAAKIHELARGFKQTGQLGDVMRESAEIAYSYVSEHLSALGGQENFFDKAAIHLHVPEGATPKDGPSAGITMATALLSLARGRKIARPLAMTGELTLTGKVLPVGGVREKMIALRRVGLKEVILPEDNRKDIDEMPEHLKTGITVHYASRYPEVVEIAFSSPAKRQNKKR